jgi:hypothetical protein
MGCFISALKIVLYEFAFINAFLDDNAVALNWWVCWAQFFAILVASFTQCDIANAVKSVYEGYDYSLSGNFDGAVAYGKWVVLAAN